MNLRLSALVGLASVFIAGHVVAGTPAQAPGKASTSRSQQQVDTRSAEVTRLKHDVAAEEDKGRQADQRLQEQDKTIADLQGQLKALQVAPASQAKHP